MNKDQINTLTLIGITLLCVQQAEHVLSDAVESFLERPGESFIQQSETKQRQTLGDLLQRLKRQIKLEYGAKERLFKFLKMRNKFVHNPSEISGWNWRTKEGRVAIRTFLAELSLTALAITSLSITLFHVSAKDEFGVDISEALDEQERAMFTILEEQFGATARKILAERYHKPKLVKSAGPP